MIRPLTLAAALLAAGSALYLYQAKHEAQLLDQTIEEVVRDTAALRGQSRRLAAEWVMRNDPEALRRFADDHLALKPIAPSQFTSLVELDGRLPPIRAGAPAPVEAARSALVEAEPALAAALPPGVAAPHGAH